MDASLIPLNPSNPVQVNLSASVSPRRNTNSYKSSESSNYLKVETDILNHEPSKQDSVVTITNEIETTKADEIEKRKSVKDNIEFFEKKN
jgi:hypothetical protein